jgi:ribosomal protein S18 acetylase RimI-like enzyme
VIEIVNHSDELKEYLKKLNVEWLEKYFRVEDVDVLHLNDPDTYILNKGGFIFYAKYNHEVVGTASLLKINASEYELGKMAVTEKAQGLGIGTALMEHCISFAEKLKVKRLILYSNKSLGPALHLYRKYGFHEVEMESGHYDRANIKMEKLF